MSVPAFDTVLVVDFGAQYAQLIARRVREANVYSEIVPYTISAAEIAARRPAGIILSGGPKSVYADQAPVIDAGIYGSDFPILGICYGAQLMAQQLGGEVKRTGGGEYGGANITITDTSVLLGFDRPGELRVWMSHADSIAEVPTDFRVSARTSSGAVAMFEDDQRMRYAVQFHPEVVHTPCGQKLLKHFLYEVAGCRPTWTASSILESQVRAARARVGDERVICGLSGGVDSAVAAALVHRAVGSQLTCVYVDTGLMREGESDQVVETFRRHQGIELIHVRAAERFYQCLVGVVDPEEKRKAIGERFIREFEVAAQGLEDARFLVQGTLYPDVIESGTPGAARIKSHHNVGGLPDDLNFELVEPLRALFKDEVRRVGEQLGLPEEIVWRQPFPGPGLAVRILGEVTTERLDIVRQADAIVREEIKKAGLEREIWQAF
ncbi:MAG TPA: glutamine-hydrolyzing GMP synthase, partial [Candidatus Saccharimonadales bacterium]|nr:glutamine-hydrolyzing GMP synthase [Candidatus Saccharimonadales bacterium]